MCFKLEVPFGAPLSRLSPHFGASGLGPFTVSVPGISSAIWGCLGAPSQDEVFKCMK